VRFFALIAVSLLASLAFAQTAIQPNTSPEVPAAELSTGDAIALGAIEGVTEYLPISSTGHLIIATRALKLDSDEPLRRPDGTALWFVAPSEENPTGTPLTVRLAADTYTIIIQFGAIAAVALLYWRPVLSMLRGLLGRDPAGFRLLRNLILAFLPAAILGLLLHDWIDAHLFSVKTVIIAQVLGALLIFWAERYRRARAVSVSAPNNPGIELTTRQALNIGLLQCVAMWPGTSRSMMTIIGGYLSGLDPRRSAEFSFLLGLVTLTAASVYKGYKSGTAMIDVFGWPNIALGCVVAAVTAALAVKFLVGWLSRHGMALFAWYRLGLAALLTLLVALGWLG
jgi:Uncharacterized bacitracin resistance protein